MNYKPDKATLMAYLYNELDDEERVKVDYYLMENPEVRAALDSMTDTRKILSTLEDKEVIAPPLVIGDHHRPLLSMPYFKTIVGIAASLILVMLIGRLIGLHISYEDKRLTMDFGEAPARESKITQTEVQSMINSSLQENNEKIRSDWQSAHEELARSIRTNLSDDNGVMNDRIVSLVRDASSASQDQIQSYAAGIQEKNRELIRDYMQLTTSEQKDYLEKLLVDFAKYLQEQRNQDMYLMQTKLNDIQDNNTQFKKDTEQLLSGIITAVSVPNNSTRN